MTDEESQQVPESGIGRALAAARVAQGLTVADVERHLKLSARQIEALEADDFSSMRGSTFVRGFIRNYAKLLKVDPEPFLQAYQQLTPAEEIAISAVSQQIEISDSSAKRLAIYGGAFTVALILLGLLAYQFLAGDAHHKQQAVVAVPPAPAKLASTTPSKAVPEQQLTPSVAPVMMPADPAQATTVSPAPLVPPTPVMSAGVTAQQPVTAPASSEAKGPVPVVTGTNSGHIHLVFERESWVEIVDGSGKAVLSQRNPAGSQKDVVGTPPFSLVLGNAQGVSLAYNGKAIDLSQYARANVARLTLE